MAMGITQALKLQEGPIDALAQLPQQQLISMAQQGRISADMLPVILNEKAQMIQQAANMQASQQAVPPSVIEQAMAINAQAEAQPQRPQMMQQPQPQMQMPAMGGGIGELPVPENMYGGEQSFAGGGIVAFEPGGWVNQGGGFYIPEEEAGAPTGPALGLADFIRQAQGIRAAVPQPPEAAAIRKYLDDQQRKNVDVKSDAWARALEAGLGIMGGESPYALTNIGKGAQPALKGFAEDVKERRKQELANMQMKLQLDQAERAEQLAGITAGEQMYGREQDRVSRETQARLDRENRLAVASIPDKTIQVAAELRSKNPSLSYLDSVSQAAQALSPKDTYNATRTAVSAAAKDANAEFTSRLAFDPKLQEDMRKAAAGDQAAVARVKAIRDKIQESVFKLYQVEGVDLSGGKMGAPTAGVIDFSALPPGTR
jgi:hypothetical protein